MLPRTTSQHYEAFEPLLNGRRVVLPDVPLLEQQLLGLIWRGGKIDHPHGEHDDWATAAVTAAVLAAQRPQKLMIYAVDITGPPVDRPATQGGGVYSPTISRFLRGE